LCPSEHDVPPVGFVAAIDDLHTFAPATEGSLNEARMLGARDSESPVDPGSNAGIHRRGPVESALNRGEPFALVRGTRSDGRPDLQGGGCGIRQTALVTGSMASNDGSNRRGRNRLFKRTCTARGASKANCDFL
jgi:hypothetical protein